MRHGMSRAARLLTNYTVAFASVAAACSLQIIFRPRLEASSPHFIFIVAILASAWTGGFGPGLFATALSAFVADYFFVQPYYALTIFDRFDPGVVLFVVCGVLISWLSEQRLHALRERERMLALEQSARADAEAAARAKDEFLATVSHELRSPLTAIMGWTAILKRERGEETVLEARDVIERNVRVLNRLVEDLLDSARVAYGKLRLKVEQVDVSSATEAAVDVVRPAAEAKSIELAVELESKPCLIQGDPDRLQQIIWNLLSNAIKFTPRRGRVSIRLERSEGHVRVIVDDTGQGISPEFLPLVFARFRQGVPSAPNRNEGLGLGLALVRDLVELHGGSVRAFSGGPGQGATFTVELPCGSPAAVKRRAIGTE